jgi:hypothetical protein
VQQPAQRLLARGREAHRARIARRSRPAQRENALQQRSASKWPPPCVRRWRATVFEDYRLRIATVVRDYGMTDRMQAPAHTD